VKIPLLAATSALALAIPAPACAQNMHMPGMTMPTPVPPAAKKKTLAKKPAVKTKVAKGSPAHAPLVAKPIARELDARSTKANPKEDSAMPMAHGAAPPAMQAMPMEHSQMDHGQMGGMAAPGSAHEMEMTGALGPYPMARESSGTAWQPVTSEGMGLHAMSGDWMLMAHGAVSFVYDHQSGPRGDDKAFASGMLMGMARRPLGNGTLQLKVMLSPDPIMGKRGYPLLLASGETANGRDRLIDRQHPHDFFMELSASASRNIGSSSSVFLYAGLPGEPAFGPPAFMHREAILDSPEAPISHHWLDSTHITFGVVTAGIVFDRVKLEISRFNGREPDQHRWDIETGPLDSTSVRLSWNPARELSVQGSWGRFKDPEQLEPGISQTRWSMSALYARDLGPGWRFAGTLAWGRKRQEHHNDDAFVAEGSVKHRSWTVFGRAEMVENRELVDVDDHGPAYRVGKISLGAVRDFQIGRNWSFGTGGLIGVNFLPRALAPLYGGNNPTAAMAFVRLKLD
jgi:hypothetical protein